MPVKPPSPVGRVLIGPREIAGVAVGLGEGFSKLGWKAGVLDVEGHPFGYAERSLSFNSKLLIWLNKLSAKSRRCSTNPLGKFVHAVVRTFALGLGLVIALLEYDNIIFLFGVTYLPWNVDLFLFRLLGKKTLMIYCGSDSRPCYLNGGWLHRMEELAHGNFPLSAIHKRNRYQLRQLRRMAKWVDNIIDHPMSAHLQLRNCVSWLWVGLPTALERRPLPLPEGKPKILHAPSTKFGKGTESVRIVIAELAAAGYEFEYREVSDLSNAEVVIAIRDSHIIIDELYSDIGLAGLGCEAAAQGRVVVVGGYGWEYLKQGVSGDMDFPSVQVTKETLFDRMSELLRLGRDKLQALANLHRTFIETRWSTEIVASRYAAVLRGQAPREAFFDPSAINYPWGVGATPEYLLRAIRQIARCCGEDFLVPAARQVLAQYPEKDDDKTIL